MAQRDYRAYAQTPNGKAARQRAHDRYVQKRRYGEDKPMRLNPAPLAQVINNWSRA